jgi:hypothetical protein
VLHNAHPSTPGVVRASSATISIVCCVPRDVWLQLEAGSCNKARPDRWKHYPDEKPLRMPQLYARPMLMSTNLCVGHDMRRRPTRMVRFCVGLNAHVTHRGWCQVCVQNNTRFTCCMPHNGPQACVSESTDVALWTRSAAACKAAVVLRHAEQFKCSGRSSVWQREA